MSGEGGMLQMRFHFGERDRDGDGPLDVAVMDACARGGVRVAALLRGVEGFGAKHRLRTDRLLSLSEDAPLVAVAVGEAEVVEGLAEELRELARDGLVVLEVVEVSDGGEFGRDVGAARDEGEGSGGAAAGSAGGAAGEGVKVTIWGPRTGPSSPHLEAVAALKRHGADAATVLLGVDGVLNGERRRARFVAANRDVPALTVAVGARAAIDAALAEISGASLVTVEAVETSSRYAGGSLHGEASVVDNSVIGRVSLHGEAARVTLVTSEIAAGDAHPRYVELIHALRREGAAGATALRGVWGFRADGEPRGDRVLALRRDLPLIVETVDTPERAARWREIALSLAGEDDLVDCRRVPRIFTLD